LKCSCTIWPAVRVENALPFEERYAPVIALESAARGAGTTVPSSPPATAKPLAMVAFAGAPSIAWLPSTLPTRSTTTMWARRLRAPASAAAREMARSTSATVRKDGCAGAAGAGAPLPPPPPQAASASAASASAARSVRIAGGGGDAH
jgi:hypothetical protein